jgi:hypothetical protein
VAGDWDGRVRWNRCDGRKWSRSVLCRDGHSCQGCTRSVRHYVDIRAGACRPRFAEDSFFAATCRNVASQSGARKARSIITMTVIAVAVAASLGAQSTSASVDTAIDGLFQTFHADAWVWFDQWVGSSFVGSLRGGGCAEGGGLVTQRCVGRDRSRESGASRGYDCGCALVAGNGWTKMNPTALSYRPTLPKNKIASGWHDHRRDRQSPARLAYCGNRDRQ